MNSVLLRLDFLVGVEDEHAGFRFADLKIARNLACTLVRRRRTAIRRTSGRESRTVRRRASLRAACVAQRVCGPAFQACRTFACASALSSDGISLPDEVDAGGQDQAVVRERRPAGQLDGASDRIDGNRVVANATYSPFVEAVIGDGDVGRSRAAAADHEVRQRARDEFVVALDERDVDLAVAPHPDIFRRGRATVAAADDDDLRPAARLHPRTPMPPRRASPIRP